MCCHGASSWVGVARETSFRVGVARETSSGWVWPGRLVPGWVWPGRLGFGGSEHRVTAFSSSNKLLITYGVANIGPDDVVENNSLSTILLRQICFVCHSYMMSLKHSCMISQFSLTILFILYPCSTHSTCMHQNMRSVYVCMCSLHTEVCSVLYDFTLCIIRQVGNLINSPLCMYVSSQMICPVLLKWTVDEQEECARVVVLCVLWCFPR